MRFLVNCIVGIDAPCPPQSRRLLPLSKFACPASAVRTYPLESRREVQSLPAAQRCGDQSRQRSIQDQRHGIELLLTGEVVDSRNLTAIGSNSSPSVERGCRLVTSRAQVAFQFLCGTDLITPSVKLAGPTLNRDQALLVTGQAFAFRGSRDIRCAFASMATLPVGDRDHRDAADKVRFRPEHLHNLSLRGVCFVGWGASFHTGHRWAMLRGIRIRHRKTGWRRSHA